MKYRKVDHAQRAKAVLSDQALSKERQAFELEAQVDHLRALPEGDVTDVQIEDAERRARYHRKLAIGLVKTAKIAAADVRRVQRAFLEEWIESLEAQHIEHVTILGAKQAAAEATGAQSLGEDEIGALAEEIELHERAVRQLETAHEVATRRLDALGTEPKPKSKRAV